MTRKLLVRWLVLVLFFCSAIASGVCATLCQARVCCHRHSAPIAESPKVETTCCSHCKPSKTGLNQVTGQKSEGDDCCMWIAKKGDPPATTLKNFLTVSPEWVAIVPCKIELRETEVLRLSEHRVLYEDQIPPGAPSTTTQSRAPPIA